MLVFSPLTHNHRFIPSQVDLAFALEWRHGSVFFIDLFHYDSFMSFAFLCKEHNIHQSYFFRYLQALMMGCRSYLSGHCVLNAMSWATWSGLVTLWLIIGPEYLTLCDQYETQLYTPTLWLCIWGSTTWPYCHQYTGKSHSLCQPLGP